MRKAISYSLWGNNAKYLVGALANARLAQILYPGWTCRFYVAREVPCWLTEKLSAASNTEIVRVDAPGSLAAAFWRFDICADSAFDVVIFRDTDSRPTVREKAMVEDWLRGGKSVHIIRDHPLHCERMLAGMWGCRSGGLRDIKVQAERWEPKYNYGDDQAFLEAIIYSRFRLDMMVHDEFQHFKDEYTELKIYRRTQYEFVGEIFDENDVRDCSWKIVRETYWRKSCVLKMMLKSIRFTERIQHWAERTISTRKS